MVEQHIKSYSGLVDSDVRILHEMQAVDRARRSGDSDNSLPVVDVSMPGDIIIDCPKTRPASVYVKNCTSCSSFEGVAQTAWDNTKPIPWAYRYALRCGFVLERKCRQVIVK